ncbi:MAG: UvrD-helicase domain-containing protein [Candidatus Marinimicrobia bacterium]|nr:UvrD-helicase domain-containing protein [Candidatus Neomarinimicrobiota bacterium]
MSYNSKSKLTNDESIMICASAGTGKTKMLVDRFVDLIRSGKADIDQLVAITFTEKAATEMKERVYEELYKEKLFNNLIELQHAISNSFISTIHSFCARIIQENIDSTQLPYNYTIIDEAEENIIRERFTNRFLSDHIENDSKELKILLKYMSINKIKKLIFNSWERYFLIKKYKNKLTDINSYISIINNIVNSMLKSYLRDERIKNLITSLLPFKDQLNENQLLFLNNFEKNNIDRDDFTSFFSDRADKLKNIDLKCYRLYQELKNEYYSEINFLKRLSLSDIDEKFIEVNTHAYNLINEFLDKYRQELELNGLLDFTGMELYAIEFLNSKSERAIQFCKRFKYLLVDEFQDINPVQHEIIQEILNNNPKIKVFFVGDEKQSIYRFRGAVVEIMNQQKNKLKTDELLINYRSIDKLVDFQNEIFPKLFKSSKTIYPFEASYPSVPIKAQNKPRITNKPVEIIILKHDKKIPEENIDYIELEAFLIANKIKDMVNNLTIYKVKDNKFDKVKYKDIAILLRAYTHQEKYEKALKEMNIPYHTLTGFGFYNLPEVKDLINFIRALINFYDEPALIGTIRSSMFAISDDAINELATAGTITEGLHKYLYNNKKFNLSENDISKLEFFKNLYLKLQSLLYEDNIINLLENIIEETNYLSILANLKEGKRKVANVKKLLNLAREWYSISGLSPVDFVRKINTYKNINVKEGEALKEDTDEDSVKIMTIHSSKGLDFPVVIIPLSYSLTTSSPLIFTDENAGTVLNIKDQATKEEPAIVKALKKLEQLKDAAEEKRIFYVGVTRASSHLIITGIEKERTRYNINWQSLRQYLQKNNLKSSITIKEIIPEDIRIGKEEVHYEEIALKNYKRPRFSKDKIDEIRTRTSPIEKKITRITPTEYADKTISTITPYNVIADSTPLNPVELGNLVHKALSLWDYKNLDDIKNYIVDLINIQRLTGKEKSILINEIFNWIENFASSGNPVYQLIRNSQEIKTEVEVMGYINNIFIEGAIDLLLKNEQSYYIIDYKTDHSELSKNDTVIKKYKAQLDLYATVLYECYHLPVREYLIHFLRNNKTIRTTVNNELILSVIENLKNITP